VGRNAALDLQGRINANRQVAFHNLHQSISLPEGLPVETGIENCAPLAMSSGSSCKILVNKMLGLVVTIPT
jgi:hypothetical protein